MADDAQARGPLGHRFTLWPEPGTELTLDLDGTSLVLPVVGGSQAWSRATSGAGL